MKKIIDIISTILFLLLIFFIGLMPILLVSSCVNELINTKIEYHYIDLDGNQGIAENCDRNMTCRINGRIIQIKTYERIIIKENK